MNFDEIIKESKPEKLENRIKNMDPTLPDISYEPDTSSWNFRLTVKRFTDPETKAVIMPSLPYLMPQIYGGRVLGVYTPSSHEINQDLTLPSSEYSSTQNHELLHAKGHNEYVTRFLNNDDYADYN